MSLGLVLLIALGGALAFEGVVWAIFPSQARRGYAQMMAQMSDRDLHRGGLVCVALGVALLAFALNVAS